MSKRGGIFVGFMFLGLGIGMLFGNAGAGVIIGMGIGFILSELFERRGAIEYEEVKKRIKRNYGIRLASGLLGILFIWSFRDTYTGVWLLYWRSNHSSLRNILSTLSAF